MGLSHLSAPVFPDSYLDLNGVVMSSKLARLKPGVPRRVHLFAAALLWTAVGVMLMSRGIHWLNIADRLVWIVPALLLGFIKSRIILERTVEKNIDRILHFKDGTCLGAVYSKETWLLVLVMIGMGVVLRHSSLPRSFLAIMYIMVGWALIWASRKGWQAWLKKPENEPESAGE